MVMPLRRLLVAVTCLVAVSTASAVALEAPFFVWDAPKNALFSEMAIHPQAIQMGGTTYITYQGPDLNPNIVAHDSETAKWTGPVQVGVNPLWDDMHGAPALLADATGRLHVFYGGHHSALLHVRAREASSIAAWDQLPPVADRHTYPQPSLRADGTIEIFYRDSGTARKDWVSRRSLDTSGATWGPSSIVLAGGPDYGWYAHFSPEADGSVHLAFTTVDWVESARGDSWARHDVYYARRDSSGIWRNAAGTRVRVPITRAEAESKLRVLSSGTANTNCVVAGRTPGGDPAVLYVVGQGGGAGSYRFRFARYGEEGWVTSEVDATDHFYDACTWAVAEGGELEAFLVTGGTMGIGHGDRRYLDDGGAVVRYTSSDDGGTWSRDTTVSPDAMGAVFNNPQVVQGGNARSRLIFTEWRSGTSISSIEALGVYLWGSEGLVGRSFPVSVARVNGGDSLATAVEVSRRAYPSGSDSVVIVSEASAADALTASPFAHAARGPILYAAGGLRSDVVAEIKRLKPKVAYVIGGREAVPTKVEDDLRLKARVASVKRIGGTDRYATAVLVGIRSGILRRGGTVVIANGSRFADALAMAPVAAVNGYPILLVAEGAMPRATANALEAIRPSEVIVVGGEAAVHPEVAEAAGASVRLGGRDRYDTASSVAEFGEARGLRVRHVVIAGGASFSDALSAGVYAARLGSPLLLTRQDTLHASPSDYLDARSGRVVSVRVIGRQDAVSDAVLARIAGILK